MPEAIFMKSELASNVSSSSVSFEIKNPQARGCVLSSLMYLRYRIKLGATNGGIACQAGINVTGTNAALHTQQSVNAVLNTGIALGDGFPIQQRAANLISLTINTCNIAERTNLFYQGLLPYIMSKKLMSRVGNKYYDFDQPWRMGERWKGKLYQNYSAPVEEGLAWCITEMRRRLTSAAAVNERSSSTYTDSEYLWAAARGDNILGFCIEIFEPLCIGPIQPFFLRKAHEVNPTSCLSNWSPCIPLVDSLSLQIEMNGNSKVLGNNLFCFYRGNHIDQVSVIGAVINQSSLLCRWISSPPSWKFRNAVSLELPLIHANHSLTYVGALASGAKKDVVLSYNSLTSLPDYFLFQVIQVRDQRTFDPIVLGPLDDFAGAGVTTAAEYEAALDKGMDAMGEILRLDLTIGSSQSVLDFTGGQHQYLDEQAMDMLCMENAPSYELFPYQRGPFRKSRHAILLSPAQMNILAPSPNIDGSISFQGSIRVRNSTSFDWGAQGAVNSYVVVVSQIIGSQCMHITEKSATLRRKTYGPETGQALRLGTSASSGAGLYRPRF
jgi:hypothetical protein